MESIGNTINYLSIEGLPWVLLAWIGLIVFRPFATLVHEIGHLIPAVILTKKEVSNLNISVEKLNAELSIKLAVDLPILLISWTLKKLHSLLILVEETLSTG